MMHQMFIFALVAVMGCHGQSDTSSDMKQRNNAGGSDDVTEQYVSGRSMQRREEMDSKNMYKNCFVSKGCFGYPSGCIPRSDCEVFLSFKDEEGGITFKMYGFLESNFYMAMGLSMDSQMGDDAVTECFRVGSIVKVRESWNEGKTNVRTRELPPATYKGDFKDGLTTCSWTEGYIKETNNRTFNFVNSSYHLLLAKGPMQAESLGYHIGRSRIASQEAVNFAAFDTIDGEGVSDSVKIHDSSYEKKGDSETTKNVGSELVFNTAVILFVFAPLKMSRWLKL